MRFTTSDGVELYYESIGEGELIVLTHGSWGDAGSWAGVVDPLSAHHRVVTWDRRGHTRSADGTTKGTFSRDADDLAELISHLGGEPAHLVGSSSGASIVLKTVAGHPGSAASACVHEPDMIGLVDPNIHGGRLESEREENLRVIRLINEGRTEEAARLFIDEIAVGPGTWQRLPPEAREGFVANAETIVDEFDDVFDPDPLDFEAVETSQAPILITRGTESPPLLLSVSAVLEDRMPQAQFVIFEGVGHIPYRTHPELWCRTVLDFVASTMR